MFTRLTCLTSLSHRKTYGDIMQVGVVGGGIFGCCAAIVLSEQGHRVHLYERHNKLLPAASFCNQYRLHAGYHYPRSDDTARECKQSIGSFAKAFPGAIVDNDNNYYSIAKKGSKLTPDEYIDFLERHNLFYEKVNDLTSHTALTVRVRESRFDIRALHKELLARLQKTGVTIHLNTEVGENIKEICDKVVLCAYSSNNKMEGKLGIKNRAIARYELCEKPVIQLPAPYRDFSHVVMDGEFCSLDPAGRTGKHVLGHVKHAIHKSYEGHDPEGIWYNAMPDQIDQGIVDRPNVTNYSDMLRAAMVYNPVLRNARYIGSMFTIRTVKPNVDDTDERPTLVNYADDEKRIIKVFSGKVGTCVEAALKVGRFVGR